MRLASPASLVLLMASAAGCASLPHSRPLGSTPSAATAASADDRAAYRIASDVTALPLGWQLGWERPRKSYEAYDPEAVFYRPAHLCAALAGEAHAGLLVTLRDAAAPRLAVARVRARPRGDGGIGHACDEVWVAEFHRFVDRDGEGKMAVRPPADPPLDAARVDDEPYAPATRFPPECWSPQGCDHEAWETLTPASPTVQSVASTARAQAR